MKRFLRNLTLFQKFAAAIILVGLIPMLLLTVFVSGRMVREYNEMLQVQYEQAAYYVSSSLHAMLDSYNTISKIPYDYNYGSEVLLGKYSTYDNLRQIMHGDNYDPAERDARREEEMQQFLRYIEGTDSYLNAAHFVGLDAQGNQRDFHYRAYSGYFLSGESFEQETGYQQLDLTSNQMILIPTHEVHYYSGVNEPVFTVARNYFDLRGEKIADRVYVGTLLFDIDLHWFEQIFRTVRFHAGEELYVINDAGDCFYSNTGTAPGTNLGVLLKDEADPDGRIKITTGIEDYGLYVVVRMDPKLAFMELRTLQNLMYLILALAAAALVVCSMLFSKALIRPVHEMMKQMEQVENGNFDLEPAVHSANEIDILSDRFNQMSQALKKYINESYGARLRQKEAELTALKSQIYPHFLYNTLEIIRMTALENDDPGVSRMIEALSVQIHYLIGTASDMVPLEKEIDIVRKYIYLLNCRISCKVLFSASIEETGNIMVPKLILQPMVENAYIHGIKPQNGNGSIRVETLKDGEDVEICVFDNGVGMDRQALEKIEALLSGDAPGIRDEYNWQSIGIKNIHERLRYLYGEGYGIRVTSTPQVGTMVSVRMPLIREETAWKSE